MNDVVEMQYGNSEKREPFQYTWSGLDNIYLCSGYERVPDGAGDYDVVIHDMDGLHRTVGEYLALHKKALTGKEIRFLRKQMDLTQIELASPLGTTDQSVARWEKGEFEIPGPAELLIRCFYVARQINKQLDLFTFAQALREQEAPATEKLFFTETEQGWEKKAA